MASYLALLLLHPSIVAAWAPSPVHLPTAVRPVIVQRCASPTCDAATATAIAAKASNLFNNIRTPAALAAGASLTLAFGGIPTDDKKITPRLRLLKRLMVVVGYMSLCSELLTVLMCTNAINRLSMDVALRPELFEAAASKSRPVFNLLSSPVYRGFWVGTYLHFVFGLFGMMSMASIKAVLVVNGGMAGGMGLLAGAIGTRMLATVNRASVVQDFGSGSFTLLALRYVKWTFTSAFSFTNLTPASLCDALSFVLLACAIGRFAWAAYKDPVVDGEGFW